MSKNTTPPGIDPKRIARLLTRAAERLDADTAAALRHARNRALQRQAATKPFSPGTGHHIHWPLSHAIPQWVGSVALLLAIVAGGIGYWHHAMEEMSHLEVAILTDDMPMEVFVDR